MTKLAKIISAIIGIVIILFIIAIFLMMTLVNPNNFKSQISSAVQNNTGRAFAISGDIKWSFFPWLGLKVNQMALGNAPGFGQQPFAQLDEADIDVKLLPLFFGKVQMGAITLKHLTVNLTQNAQGENNWNDLVAKTKQPHVSTAQQVAAAPVVGAKKMADLHISKINIIDANVNYQNQQTGQIAKLSDFNLTSNNVNLNRPFPAKFNFNLSNNKPLVNTHVIFSTNLTLNPDSGQYRLQDLRLDGVLIGKQYPNGNLPFSLNANANADLKQQTLDVSNIVANLANMQVDGHLQGVKLLETPIFNGKLNVPGFNLKSLLTSLGINLVTQDPNTLHNVSLQGQYQFSPKYFKISTLTADVDDTHLVGHFNYADLGAKTFDFALNLNQIDLNRYMSVESQQQLTGAPTQPAAAESAAKANASANNVSAGLPVPLLRQLKGTGSLSIDKLTVNKISAAQVNLQLIVDEGLIKLVPVSAQLYQGKSNGVIQFNVRGHIPELSVNEALTQINVGALMADVSKNSKVQITGIGNLDLNLTTQGQDANTMMKNLNGSAKFAVNNGSIKNIDLGQQLYAVLVRYFNKNTTTPAATNETSFSSLTGTAAIRNGVIQNNDLALNSTALKVTGSGTANLVTQTIDYNLKTTAIGEPFGRDVFNLQNQIGGSFPLRITGTFSDPKTLPDFTAIGTTLLKGQFRQQIEKRFGPQFDNTLNKLKGLLGQ